MENLDYQVPDQPSRKANSNGRIFNLLTVLILLCVVCLAGVFLSIFLNPYSSLNPFPPPTIPPTMSLPSTLTPTPTPLYPPTWTPTATREPTSTETPRPTSTLPPTATSFTLATETPIAPSPTVTPPRGGYPFLKDGPIAAPNIAHPDLSCNWMGVAGKVLDMSGGPKTQLIVVLGGTLAGKSVDSSGVKYSLSGVAPLYGPSGYEFVLSDKPLASNDTLWIQLVDQAGKPLSEKVFFDTYNDCQKNLIIISFKQVK